MAREEFWEESDLTNKLCEQDLGACDCRLLSGARTFSVLRHHVYLALRCQWINNGHWSLSAGSMTKCKIFCLFSIMLELLMKGRGAMVKDPLADAGDGRVSGSTPGSGRSPGEENGNPLQCSCLENSVDREAWRATVHRVAKSQI